MGKNKNEPTREEVEISRIKTPKGNEMYGVVTSMVGGDKMRVNCEDGNERLGRIPGKLRKRVWIREGDLVIIEPWSVQGHERGDIRFRYTQTQANYLKRKGLLKIELD